MQPSRRAVIDIGTNSVKLLVADVAGANVSPIVETSEQTRLGKNFYETRVLHSAAIANTASAVARFAEQARRDEAGLIRVIATSAARDALNQRDLVDAVERASGLNLEIISGEQEADWAFDGVMSDPRLAECPLLIVDVGGGSSEFILGEARVQHFRNSFRLGSVRLLEEIRPSDPPEQSEWERCREWLKSFLEKEIKPALAPALSRFAPSAPVQLVGTGGAASILAGMQLELPRFVRERIESASLTQSDVWEHHRRLWSLPLAQRRDIIGLPPDRADVILMGVAIFAMVMQEFGFETLRASTRGLRFGALLHPG